jgi:hypothetical protein
MDDRWQTAECQRSTETCAHSAGASGASDGAETLCPDRVVTERLKKVCFMAILLLFWFGGNLLYGFC